MLGVCKLLLVPTIVAASVFSVKAAEVRVVVDAGSVLNTMRGGIGASWHAIDKPITTEYDSVFNTDDHGGSAWGGNPPAENNAAWQQLYRHAAWLGLDFVRVELEQRMYEPDRGKFDWDNPEMRSLYRILDWCQQNQVDVFLTQMWSNVDWNAFPEFRDRPAGIVHSGPLSMDDFAEGLATCVEHLVKRKGYTCIKWLCITNEPGEPWSWWNRPANEPMPLKPGLEAVRKALDKRKLDVPLSAPDYYFIPPFDPQRFDFSDLVGAYDFHTYQAQPDWGDQKEGYVRVSELQQRMAAWADWAHQQGKPLLITESGAFFYGRGPGHQGPGPASYEAAFLNSQLVVRGLAAGVDGISRWDFTDLGEHPDGHYQMVETWDRENRQLLKEFLPKPNPYFTYGLLSRFTAKHSQVLSSQVEGGTSEEVSRVFAVAVRSPRGNLTHAIVNDATDEWTATVEVGGLTKATRLYRYVVSAADRDQASLQIEPKGEFMLSEKAATITDRLPATSLTIYTSYRLGHAVPGIICD